MRCWSTRRAAASHGQGADDAGGPVARRDGRGRARCSRAAGGRPPRRSTRFAHGMTVATNALLEGRGARTVLVATEGFTDVVELGRQARADLYRLCAAHPRRSRRPSGASPRPSAWAPTACCGALEDAGAVAAAVAAHAPEAVAVCLLHAYRHPAHERRARRRARRGAAATSTSRSPTRSSGPSASSSAPRRPRSTPPSRPLLRRLPAPPARRGAREAGLPEPAIMQSSGGLTDAATRRGPRRADRAQRAGRRRGGRRAAGRAGRRARPAVLRHGRHVVRRVRRRGRRACARPPGARSAAARSRCRWSTSTRSAPAAARSPGATPGGALRVGPALGGRRPGPGLLRARRRPSRR